MVDDDRGVIWTDPDVRSSHQVPRHCFSILVLTEFRDRNHELVGQQQTISNHLRFQGFPTHLEPPKHGPPNHKHFLTRKQS